MKWQHSRESDARISVIWTKVGFLYQQWESWENDKFSFQDCRKKYPGDFGNLGIVTKETPGKFVVKLIIFLKRKLRELTSVRSKTSID